MGDISSNDLKYEIKEVLKNADLSVVSAKKIREQVEQRLNCSLIHRKKEVDTILMNIINQQQEENAAGNNNDESDDDATSPDDDASSGDKQKSKKRPHSSAQQQRKTSAPKKKKRKTLNASDSGTESDGGSDSDYKVPKNKNNKKKSNNKNGDSNTGGSSGRKSTGFTRPLNLSPELSELVGAEALPRHEVVKKVWAIIKERNLYDAKNKQFAICDDQLLKVMQVKRFRIFGMLKHLKPHFLN